MRIIILTILTAVAMFSCDQPSQQLSAAQLKVEQKAVWTVIEKFTAAIDNESWESFKVLLTEDCIIYGTDIINVDQGFKELEPHMQMSFDMIENSNIADFRDKSIKLKCNMCSAMFNATWNTRLGGADVTLPTRWAFTLEKKKGAWLVSQCSVSIPSVGESRDKTAH